jgi:hypothetical protein
LRIQLEGTVEDLWRQFQSALNTYNTTTDERKRAFEELKTKDQKNAKEIELQMKKLMKLQVLWRLTVRSVLGYNSGSF